MTIAATVWAFETERVQSPVERLLLILMADCADDFGVVALSAERLADQARLNMDELRAATAVLVADRTLSRLPGAADAWEGEHGLPPPDDLEFLVFSGWEDRARLRPGEPHPMLGPIALP